MFDTHVIAARIQGIEGRSQVSQTFPKGELTETQAQKLIPASKATHTIITIVLVNDFSKFVFGNDIHKL